MCTQDDQHTQDEISYKNPDGPSDWQTLPLPPDHVLSHHVHCHPTDLNQSSETYNDVKLGGLASMATIPEDQCAVKSLGKDRPWSAGPSDSSINRPRVVSCFGYHPWFTHRYTLSPDPPSKESHYSSIFFPASAKQDSPRRLKEKTVLKALLPHLPTPISFTTLLHGIRRDIIQAREEGRLVMLGEVGLDGAARVLWPVRAKHLYDEDERTLRSASATDKPRSEESDGRTSDEGNNHAEDSGVENGDYQHVPYGAGEWKRLTPFKISMEHQKAVLRAQLEVAVELGVPVSLHCVAASGPTMEVLKQMRDTFGTKFTNRVNVDLHSGGGWSPEFWSQASKQLSNLYASPSIYITSRTSSAASLIRSITPDRILVESDTHDVTQSTRLVWAATEWIARVKGWNLEGRDKGVWEEGWDENDLVESDEQWETRQKGGIKLVSKRTGDNSEKQGKRPENDIWTVKTLEGNWARFMGLIQPYE